MKKPLIGIMTLFLILIMEQRFKHVHCKKS